MRTLRYERFKRKYIKYLPEKIIQEKYDKHIHYINNMLDDIVYYIHCIGGGTPSTYDEVKADFDNEKLSQKTNNSLF